MRGSGDERISGVTTRNGSDAMGQGMLESTDNPVGCVPCLDYLCTVLRAKYSGL